MAFLSKEQLKRLGLKSCGDDVLISDKATIINPANISIGSNVRIDDFCILSAGKGGIHIGCYVHTACYVSLIGMEEIRLNDFVNISSKCSVYSSSDDYSGEYLVGPTIPDEFKNVDHRPVIFGKYSLVGAGSVILPGVTIGEGTAIGALSLVKKSVNDWGIYSGSPLRFIVERSKDLIHLAEKLQASPK